MDQTPIHENNNPDLLTMIPPSVKNVIEVGCSSGALAREFKNTYQNVNWVGVEIDETYGKLAEKYCDRVVVSNIDDCDESFYTQFSDRDCWVFGDSLEHFKDPWLVLKQIRNVIPDNGCITACIPNAQHWSLVVKLAMGDFRYQDSGLLDRTHLRWFTRQTIVELFASQGFKIVEGIPRVFDEPEREQFIPLISEIATACNVNPEGVIKDLMPLQYVVRAIPI